MATESSVGERKNERQWKKENMLYLLQYWIKRSLLYHLVQREMSRDNFLGFRFVYVAWYFLYIGYQDNVVECGIQESGLIYLKSGLVRL